MSIKRTKNEVHKIWKYISFDCHIKPNAIKLSPIVRALSHRLSFLAFFSPFFIIIILLCWKWTINRRSEAIHAKQWTFGRKFAAWIFVGYFYLDIFTDIFTVTSHKYSKQFTANNRAKQRKRNFSIAFRLRQGTISMLVFVQCLQDFKQPRKLSQMKKKMWNFSSIEN